jgi:hypothetical protein
MVGWLNCLILIVPYREVGTAQYGIFSWTRPNNEPMPFFYLETV